MTAIAPLTSQTSEQLTVSGAATATNAAQLRQRFSEWLRERGVSAVQRNDILMAVNEALANCVDHAYADRSAAGPMTVRADFEPTDRCLSVCITDHGSWRPSEAGPQRLLDRRGRGVTLMHALVDHCTISGRLDGTTVCLDYRCRP
ncbi:ATP-binding protein [Mycobacterium sp. NAZ190054]|uniref:ATP-binding protein n=1 Tax=Mycobacterium sp. NAZ190054 TaxID=1747766 RepID=UPI00079AC453|nr:ATP-binding protein [Mycobacterium sp. NAZ190054]KWX69169.1 anti-sigma regulatory factor [Mycobacterium sp. NAZ190054]